MERIAKIIARSGICSRREAEKLILNNCVKVNGKLVLSPAFNISINDQVSVNGKKIPKFKKTRLWKFYKPKGLVVSHSDEKKRETIFQRLPKNMPRVISVGRLDINSEGLLLLTNDGSLSRKLELPVNNFKRKYRVRIRGNISEEDLKKISNGIKINGINYKSFEFSVDKNLKSNSWLSLIITEGKNREIRNIIEFLGFSVSRLIRVSYGPFLIENLKPGEISEVSFNDLQSIYSRSVAK